MKTARFIQVDGTETPIEPDDGKKFTLAKLQELVGGYVEPIASGSDRENLMLADEDGRMKQLELNPRASEIAGQPIVGNVLIVPRSAMR